MSGPSFRWQIRAQAPEQFLRSFPMYPPQIATLLYQRGLQTKEAINSFLGPPDLAKLPDPLLLLDMERAIARLGQALKHHERVVVHGDCDPDGACGAAVLYELLAALGIETSVYLPDREREGHAISKDALSEIVRRRAALVMTVDCGVREHDSIATLREHSIDTIVLDHHLPAETLPQAHAVIDPQRKDDVYPFKWLCGTGVAFVFAHAIAQDVLGKGLPEKFLEQLLDLVAIATVADMVPLHGSNRTLLRLGIQALRATKRPGLEALFRAASVNAATLTAYEIAFEVSTRLNAASRFDHTDTAFALLTTTSVAEAERLAKALNRQNRLRQKEVLKVFTDAVSDIDDTDVPDAIVLASSKWSGVVLGVAAHRVVERFGRPAFLFSVRDGIARGSGRSVEGVDLVAAMRACGGKELFEDFGGHAMAAGCTLKAEWVPIFRERLQEYVRKTVTQEMRVPRLTADLELGVHEATPDLLAWFDRLEPFGKGNERPRVAFSNLVVIEARAVGRGEKTLALKLAGGPSGRMITAFVRGERATSSVRAGDTVDVLGELRRDGWKQRNGVVLSVLAIRAHNK